MIVIPNASIKVLGEYPNAKFSVSINLTPTSAISDKIEEDYDDLSTLTSEEVSSIADNV